MDNPASDEESQFTADQLHQALMALGMARPSGPDTSPDGPTEDDIPHLLGGLLYAAERAILLQAKPDSIDRVYVGYHQVAASNAWLPILWNRVLRTEQELNRLIGSPLVDAAEQAIRAASRMLALAMHAELSRRDGVDASDEDLKNLFAEIPPALHQARKRFHEVRRQIADLGYDV